MKVIDCKVVANEMLTKVKLETTKIYAKTGKAPQLVVISVGENPASQSYIKQKKKKCEETGIAFRHIELTEDEDPYKIYAMINELNYSPDVTSIILQLPLPDRLKEYENMLTNAIVPSKDCDGLTRENIGRLWNNEDCISAATPTGFMNVLPQDLSNKKVVVINRSSLVGKPTLKLLLDRNASVQVLHSKCGEELMYEAMSSADIIITAIGNPKWLQPWMLRYKNPKLHCKTIIDVAICRVDGKLCGDVDINAFANEDIEITPVPGGCGVLTTAQLMTNVMKCYELQHRGE